MLGRHTDCCVVQGFLGRAEVLFSQAARVPLVKRTRERLRGLRYLSVESVKGCPLKLRPFVPAGVIEQSEVYF